MGPKRASLRYRKQFTAPVCAVLCLQGCLLGSLVAAEVTGDPSPGDDAWNVNYFPIDLLPKNVHPQDLTDITKFAR
jgi:hypothetical protein